MIFGYPFESCTRGLDCGRRRVVLGSQGHSRPMLDQPGTKGIWKNLNYGFKNKK